MPLTEPAFDHFAPAWLKNLRGAPTRRSLALDDSRVAGEAPEVVMFERVERMPREGLPEW